MEDITQDRHDTCPQNHLLPALADVLTAISIGEFLHGLNQKFLTVVQGVAEPLTQEQLTEITVDLVAAANDLAEGRRVAERAFELYAQTQSGGLNLSRCH